MLTTKAALALLTAALPHESPALLSLLVEFEGFRTTAYVDSAGYWTIGVGHRLGDDEGRAGLRWSASQIAEALCNDIEEARARFPSYALLEAPQRAALTSLAFNVGDIRGSALVSLIDSGANLQEVVREWVTWDHVTLSAGDHEVSRGLLLRRLRESALYVEGAK